MKLADKIKAVEALRTTSAVQIHGEFTDGASGRCALGVISDAFDVSLVGDDPYEALLDIGVPVDEVVVRNDGRFERDSEFPHAIRCYTFAEIADWIEANVPADEIDELEQHANTAPVAEPVLV